jgi:gliding motility-associated protein GldM
MGHGKETPRQKMIGMMYLVLTAMLALNVSAEVLDAFRLVNEGIRSTTENYNKKNESIYKEFEQEVAKNEQKAREWKDKAFEVRDKADSLFQYIQDLKVEIIKNNQGENIAENEALEEEDGHIVVQMDKIKGDDKSDAGDRILIGKEFNGEAYELKQKIIDYREDLLSYVDEEDTKIREVLEKTLNTDDPEPIEGHEKKEWEVKHFYKIPLAATMPIMSKLQGDVRNAESEVIQYLLNQIEAGSFTFNKLEATVIPNSNYVIQGNEYKADVFLAARDTTAPPQVFIGQWDSIRQDDGTYTVEMTRIDDTLTVEHGKGKFSVKTNRTGVHEWGGIIRLMGPEGNYIQKPFKREYEVSKPNLVISPTKMNVFYVGIPNPVDISVPSVPPNKIRATVQNGSIYKQGPGQYEVKPNTPGRECLISVRAEVEGKMRSYGTKRFRVKGLPTPVAQVANQSGGDIRKEVLSAQSVVVAEMEDFLFDLEYTVTQYTITTTDRGGYVQSVTKDNNRIDQEARDFLRNVNRGGRVNFEDLRAVGPDGTVKKLNPITFTIQ